MKEHRLDFRVAYHGCEVTRLGARFSRRLLGYTQTDQSETYYMKEHRLDFRVAYHGCEVTRLGARFSRRLLGRFCQL
ncbi:hypothetical protein Pyn_00825 [Prunus yedoensis var. nudiflora]|uniref:Uncharacterized protein n=1 Tax=Prunus yedoensis var. nudiflora TaxID=2094558 RepID=A0A314ZA72_PRUYE|nr:hypothetical protein Pyn_00825 [Prunus yedoensis var. nudiflora]